jgi:hypothetical protein
MTTGYCGGGGGCSVTVVGSSGRRALQTGDGRVRLEIQVFPAVTSPFSTSGAALPLTGPASVGALATSWMQT